MNKKTVFFVMFVFFAAVLAGCNLPSAQYSDQSNEPMYNEEMHNEEPKGEMFEEPEAEHPEEEMHEEEPREEEMHEEEPREGESHENNAGVQVEYFRAEPQEIMYGECSLLVWRIEGQANFELNGYPIGNYDTMEVCPEDTTTYELIIRADGKEWTEKTEVSVIRNPVD